MADLIFGKYEMIRRLAQGGMGEVFLARQGGVAGFDRLVILKNLRPDLAEEKGFVEQFLDEARVAATLNHPNIVSIYEVGLWEGTYYIAMEYISGEDLSRLWYAAAKKGVGLPFQVTVKILHDAALGLDHAHHALDVHGNPLHVVHRDISPQNIMVRSDGVTKVVDFGIAKAQNRMTSTQTGTVKGKLQYMSPEQVRGENLDGRSDLWSLGVVLWEMCTGKRLFKAESEIDTLNKILAHPVDGPSTIVKAFPAQLERIILRLLERDREKRYPRGADVAADLKRYLDKASKSAGEVRVADFVQEVLGDELKARTKDLTPDASLQKGRSNTATIVDTAGQHAAARKAQTSRFVVEKSDGAQVRFSGFTQIESWIKAGDLSPSDKLSEAGGDFSPLAEHPALGPLFPVDAANDARAASVPDEMDDEALLEEFRADTEPSHPPALAPPDLTASYHHGAPQLDPVDGAISLPRPASHGAPETGVTTRGVPTTVPPLAQPALGQPPPAATLPPQLAEAQAVLSPQPQPSSPDAWAAPVAQPSLAPTPTTVPMTTESGFYANGQHAYASLPPQMTESAYVPALDARKKGGAGKWALAVILLVVVGAGGLFLSDPARRAALLGASAERQVALLRPALTALPSDDRIVLQAGLNDLAQQRAGKAESDRAVLSAGMALLYVHLAHIESEHARLLDVDDATKQDARTAMETAEQHRLSAYQRATDARAGRDDGGIGRLAMASYQALREATVEMRTDLDALLKNPRTPPRLVYEAHLIDGLFALRQGLKPRTQDRLSNLERAREILDQAAQVAPPAVRGNDARLAYAQAALSVERAGLLSGDEAKAAHIDAERRVNAILAKAPTHARARGLAARLVDDGEKASGGAASHSTTDAPAAATATDDKKPKKLSYRALVNRADRARQRGLTRRAVRDYKRALKVKSDAAEPHLGLGWCYIDLGQNRSALKAFDDAAERAPDNAESYFGIAEALRYSGQKAAAKRAYKKYLSMAPNGSDAAVARNALKAIGD